MTSDAVQIVRLIFSTIWQLFTKWEIPGTNVTPAGWIMFILCASLALRVILRLFSQSASIGSNASSTVKNISRLGDKS